MTMPATDDLEVLDTSTCWDLVRSHQIGRFAANRSGLSPLVVPVNFLVEADGEIVIRTGAGSKLDLAQEGLVALQVDEIDPVHRVGWSVLIEGLGRAHDEAEDAAPPESWAPGARPFVIRIVPTAISGRRIRLHTPDTDPRGYR